MSLVVGVDWIYCNIPIKTLLANLDRVIEDGFGPPVASNVALAILATYSRVFFDCALHVSWPAKHAAEKLYDQIEASFH